jgi:hypothetical protein
MRLIGKSRAATGGASWADVRVWPSPRLANRFRVGGIVLLSLDIGLHMGRRHQPNGVAERLKFTRPMIRRRAGLDDNEARRQPLKERQHISALQVTTKCHLTIRVNAMNLKDRFRDIKTDSRNRLHDLAPPNHPVRNSTPHRWHSRAGGEAVHSIKTRLPVSALGCPLSPSADMPWYRPRAAWAITCRAVLPMAD